MPESESLYTTHDTLSDQDRRTLLGAARDSICCGICSSRPLVVDWTAYSPPLRVPRATFVTLEIDGKLRGCIGTLEAIRPLVEGVAAHAYSAAFNDPRFPSVSRSEFEELDISISLLSRPQPLEFENEQDLLRQLRPGIDGLVFEDGLRRGTFLPSVWQQLPEPNLFLAHLKLKAGCPEDTWSNTIKVWRYTTELIKESECCDCG